MTPIRYKARPCRLTAVSAEFRQCHLARLGGTGRTGVGNEGEQIARIAGMAHRRADALVGDGSGDHQLALAQVAQNNVDIGGNEIGGNETSEAVLR